MITSMLRRAQLSGDGSTLTLDFTTGVLDPSLTFTRTSTATFINASGLVATASANTPRFDHDPTTLAPRGLLIEGQATNLLNWSESFATSGGTNNNWADTNITRNSTNNTDPANGTSALRVTASAGNGTIISTAAMGTSAQRTFSIWLRRVSGTGDIQYTLDNGSTYTTQAITSSWVRYTFAATTAAQRVGIRIVTSGDSIELWGAQLEASSGASSYIPTGASQVTRTRDNCHMDSISSWFNASQGSLVVHATKLDATAATQTLAAFSNGSTNNAPTTFLMRAHLQTSAQSGGASVDVTATHTTTLQNNVVFRQAAAYQGTTQVAVGNGGGAVNSNTSNDFTGVGTTRFHLGQLQNGLQQLTGTIRLAKYWPIALPNAQLQSLTT